MTKRISSPKHLKWIRTLRCCQCDIEGVEAHHLMSAPRAMSMKAGDDQVVPLCGGHHRLLHETKASQGARGKERAWGLELIADGLWKNTGDTQKAYEIIEWGW